MNNMHPSLWFIAGFVSFPLVAGAIMLFIMSSEHHPRNARR